MKGKKSWLVKMLSLAIAAILVFSFVGCAKQEVYRLSYYDETDSEKGFNENLFYINDMPAACADPTCIYIDDETDTENYGWFYMYPTSSLYGGFGLVCYRSRDMKTWEYVCPVFEPAYDEETGQGAWMNGRLWAPEVFYDEESDKYILFGSASNNSDQYNKYCTVFYSQEDKEYWHEVAAEVESEISGKTTVDANEYLWDIVQEEKAFLESVTPGVPASDGKTYSASRLEEALDDIEALNDELFFDNGELDTSNSAVSANYSVLLFAAICARAADVKAMKDDFAYGLYVATSDSPTGPFVQYTNIPGTEGYDPNARTIGLGDPFLSAEDVYPWLMTHQSEYWQDLVNGNEQQMAYAQETGGQLGEDEIDSMTLIDVHPFVDPNTGKKYLYAAAYAASTSYIIGVELSGGWTSDPKWETMTRLTRVGYYTANDLSDSNRSTDLSERSVNEGPWMTYHNGKYYMTLSINNYTSKQYAVIQAVADSPLGPFRKLTLEEGGKILGSEIHWDHIGGPGHHSLCEYNGNTYIIYHSHYDRVGGEGTRGSCFDPIVWTKNAEGLDIMHCNGPTYSVQPKCGPDMEYENIATEAEITASNIADGSGAQYLNDGLIRIFSWDNWLKEFESGTQKETTITLTFDDYRTVRALMVYNSYDYLTHWEEIDRVEFDVKKEVNGEEKEITAIIENLRFDTERYINDEDEGFEFMRPGGAAIAEFAELPVKEIRITFKHDSPIAVSEIYVLGK